VDKYVMAIAAEIGSSLVVSFRGECTTVEAEMRARAAIFSSSVLSKEELNVAIVGVGALRT
jgi:hypothetical protein